MRIHSTPLFSGNCPFSKVLPRVQVNHSTYPMHSSADPRPDIGPLPSEPPANVSEFQGVALYAAHQRVQDSCLLSVGLASCCPFFCEEIMISFRIGILGACLSAIACIDMAPRGLFLGEIESLDPPLGEGSLWPGLSTHGDKLALSWQERDADNAWFVKTALLDGDGWTSARTVASWGLAC
jgi:hypothetical protein